jgi:hypothetical protein
MTRYKRIYRLEHPVTKVGPYRHSRSDIISTEDWRFILEMGNHHNNTNTHPFPWHDFPQQIGRYGQSKVKVEFRYGCDSKKKVRQWFGGYYKPLLEMGFVLASYKTRKWKTSISKKQTIFQ